MQDDVHALSLPVGEGAGDNAQAEQHVGQRPAQDGHGNETQGRQRDTHAHAEGVLLQGRKQLETGGHDQAGGHGPHATQRADHARMIGVLGVEQGASSSTRQRHRSMPARAASAPRRPK